VHDIADPTSPKSAIPRLIREIAESIEATKGIPYAYTVVTFYAGYLMGWTTDYE
jgi:hypothetical protein